MLSVMPITLVRSPSFHDPSGAEKGREDPGNGFKHPMVVRGQEEALSGFLPELMF